MSLQRALKLTCGYKALISQGTWTTNSRPSPQTEMGMRLQPESGLEAQLTNCRLKCTWLESNLILEAEGNGEVHHRIFIRYETLHCHHVLLRILGERKGGGEGEEKVREEEKERKGEKERGEGRREEEERRRRKVTGSENAWNRETSN